MSEREHEHGAEEQVDDLDVPESESEDVKGGSLNFQKVGGIQGVKGIKIDGVASKISPEKWGN